MISIFLNTSVLLRYSCVVCPRSATQDVPPYVFMSLQVIGLAHHQIEVAVVVDAGTQTGIIIHKFLLRHLKHKPDTFIVRIGTLVHEVHMYGGHTVCGLWLPTGTVLSANGDTILGFLCTRCTPTVGLARGYGELGVKVTLWCRC